MVIGGIEDRVTDFQGDVVVTGLAVSKGTNTLETDVASGNGYVTGQHTGSVTATTFTHSTNGTTSTRTDVIYVDATGQLAKSEGTSSAPSGTDKLAEVDVSSSDSISEIRDTRVFVHQDRLNNPHSVSLEQARSQHNVVSGAIEMAGNNLKAIGDMSMGTNTSTSHLDFTGSGQSFDFRDTVDAVARFRVNQSGPVEVLNANLQTPEHVLNASTGDIEARSQDMLLKTAGGGANSIGIWDIANGQRLFRANEGGPVEILNSNLAVNGNSIQLGGASGGPYPSVRNAYETTFIDRAGTGDGPVIYVGGGNELNLSDGTNRLVTVNEGGPVEVLNSKFNVGAKFQAWSTSSNEGRITNQNGGRTYIQTANSSHAGFRDSSATRLFAVNDGGPVEVLNADLQLGTSIQAANGNPILNIGGGNCSLSPPAQDGTGTTGFYDRANAQWLVQANEGGPVEVLNANLNFGSYIQAIEWPDQGGGYKARVTENSAGEIVARDDAGNTTTLT